MQPDSMSLVNRRLFKRIGFFSALMLLAFIAWAANGAQSEWVRVKWVADGDTIVLHDGRHVRYIGIDTPEMGQPPQRKEPMADWARSTNRQLVQGWRLRLVFDHEQTDRYGRTLAYVYRSDGIFVNAELIKTGCANVLFQRPNTRMWNHLLTAQREAMKTGVGIWKEIKENQQPDQPYRGNRSSKRFHRHDCRMGKTMATKNQVWLKNKWEAFWAGYSPARECIEFP